MASVLSEAHFHSEAAAYAFVEARIWTDGRPCPHCGVVDRSGPLSGKSNRIGALQVLRLPEAFHRQDRHDFRGQPYPDARSGCRRST